MNMDVMLENYLRRFEANQERTIKLLEGIGAELVLQRKPPTEKRLERAIKHLEEFTWLRYSENRICEKGMDEHCEIRSEIKRMECNGGEP